MSPPNLDCEVCFTFSQSALVMPRPPLPPPAPPVSPPPPGFLFLFFWAIVKAKNRGDMIIKKKQKSTLQRSVSASAPHILIKKISFLLHLLRVAKMMWTIFTNNENDTGPPASHGHQNLKPEITENL